MKFSSIEKQDLLKAWIVLSLAFAVARARFGIDLFASLIIAAFTVGIGFLLHELAHKYFAQKYGAWAEFRAFDSMLAMTLVFAFLFGFIFAAPGAVFIRGKISRKQNGIISLAGPLTNFVIGGAFLLLTLLADSFFGRIAIYGAHINFALGLFNLLPIFGLDGSKVLAWNKPLYFAVLISALVFVILINLQFGMHML